jgi:hypothetical protein
MRGLGEASFDTAKVSACPATKHLIEAYSRCRISSLGHDSGRDNASRHDELPDRLHRLVVEARLAQLLQPLQFDTYTLNIQLCIASVLPGKLGA